MPEQPPVHDPRRRFCNTFNKCPQFCDLEAENARLREALSRVAYGLEGEMGRYDAPRDNTWWGRIALDALGGDHA